MAQVVIDDPPVFPRNRWQPEVAPHTTQPMYGLPQLVTSLNVFPRNRLHVPPTTVPP